MENSSSFQRNAVVGENPFKDPENLIPESDGAVGTTTQRGDALRSYDSQAPKRHTEVLSRQDDHGPAANHIKILEPQTAYLGSGRSQSSYSQGILNPSPEFHEKALKGLEAAKKKSRWLNRPRWFQLLYQYTSYFALAAIVYFALVGRPLWNGVVYSFWFAYKDDLILKAGFVIFLGISILFAVLPILVQFEENPPTDEKHAEINRRKANDTALVIPCHKSAAIIGATLEAATKLFPTENVFIVDNANTPAPTDNTSEICARFGVHYIWSPMGSKFVAQFIGVQAAYRLPYVLLVDDDCLLPPEFPLHTERFKPGKKLGAIKCVGYAIQSCGPQGSKGTFCQQAQDLEYKLSGLQRYFGGLWSSTIFPHGAVSLWERELLLQCFKKHPGFTISEDWFFGYVSRALGARIVMCTEVFVKTETPSHLLHRGKQGRGGYGEMTVTEQRMRRWNFFLVWRMWYNITYLLFSWKLGVYEIGTKLWVFQDVYTTLLLLSFPIIFPVSVGVYPAFTIGVTVAVSFMYLCIVFIVNEIHLRRKKAQVSRRVAYLYYPTYKMYLRLVNVASVYLAIYDYAKYFRKGHPKVQENEKAMEIIVRLSERTSGDFS